MQSAVTRAMLGRLPGYLQYVMSVREGSVSATKIAKALGLGEVQVRKDLNTVSGKGKPKTGYDARELQADLENLLGVYNKVSAVLVGAGKLGRALLGYEEFTNYGLVIRAAFDASATGRSVSDSGQEILPMTALADYCRENDIHVGILTVPARSAQEACDEMIRSGITIIWDFAPCNLKVPSGITVRREDLALSFAYLNLMANRQTR